MDEVPGITHWGNILLLNFLFSRTKASDTNIANFVFVNNLVVLQFTLKDYVWNIIHDYSLINMITLSHYCRINSI